MTQHEKKLDPYTPVSFLEPKAGKKAWVHTVYVSGSPEPAS